MKRFSHLILYDGTCGLCDRTVQILLKIDKKQLFAFAPLQGTTASEILHKSSPIIKNADSSILVENFRSSDKKIYMEASCIFRILWLIGGPWKIIGCLYFVPSLLFNWAYRLVARHRYDLVARRCFLPDRNQKERFLL